MIGSLRGVFFLLGCAVALAGPPPELASAFAHLRDQKSYSWEVINADPAPVAQRLDTRRGTFTTVLQNLSPHVKGQIDMRGDQRVQRDWSDGLRLDTFVSASGASVTRTPEGWMTDREILGAIADERVQNSGLTPRLAWLRRADRPQSLRPDQEIAPLLKYDTFARTTDGGYLLHDRFLADGTRIAAGADDGQSSFEITYTFDLSLGVLRSYEMKLEGRRYAQGRVRVLIPVNQQRIVIITYVPIQQLEIPAEAAKKLAGAAGPPSPRDGN